MKFIKIFLAISLIFTVFTGFSQNVVFKKTQVDQTYKKAKIGANRNLYSWLSLTLFGTDLTIGTIDSKQDFSNYYALNWNHKFKINGFLSHGFAYGLHRQVYRLSQEGLNALFRKDWDKGKFIYWGIDAYYFWRFNFDPKRGNVVGKYLDVAAFGQYNFYQRAQFINGKLTEKMVGGDFAERFAAGVEARFGREALSLYIRYKLISNNLKKDSAPFANLDLAKWSIGLNLGFGV